MGGRIFEQRDKYSALIAASLRRMVVLIALFIVIYSLAAHFEWVVVSQWYHPFINALVVLVALTCAAWVVLDRRSSDVATMRYILIPLHALAIVLPLCITGFMSPLTVFWAALISVTALVGSKRLMSYSLLIFVAVMVASLAILPRVSVHSIASHVVYLTIILLLTYYITIHQSMQTTEHEEFIQEKIHRAAQQNQLMSLLNSVNEAIISINERGVIDLYNAATLSLLDTNQSLAGRKLDDVLVTYSESGAAVKLYRELESGAPSMQRDDLEHRFNDGETISLAISSSRVRSGTNETAGYILVIRDITKDKSLDEERDEFISVVSHELRTPVTIAEGTISNVQLLIQKGAAPSVVSEALAAAHQQTIFLSKMINDLGTLSRAERGIGGDRESIDVAKLLHWLFHEYQPKAAAKKLQLDLDLGSSLGTIVASPLYVEEILQNFLTNAIKYTEKGSVVIVGRKMRGVVTIAVKDTGIGISKSEHKKVFEKFYRAEDYRTRETSGTGLGLHIVQKLAHKIGASVELESRLNHGSTFSISFPAAVDKSPKDS